MLHHTTIDTDARALLSIEVEVLILGWQSRKKFARMVLSEFSNCALIGAES